MATKYLSSLAIGFGLALNMAISSAANAFSFTPTPSTLNDATLDGNRDLVIGITTFTTTAPAGAPISLDLNLTHDNLFDLEIYLTSPSGDILNIALSLTNGNGSINATILDSAVAAIDTGSNPYNGNFQPSASVFTQALVPTVFSFAEFIQSGEQNAGTYTLTIADLEVGNIGTLNSASVEVVPIPFEFSPAIGLGALGAWLGRKKVVAVIKGFRSKS